MKLQILAIGGTIDKVYFDALSEYTIGAPAATEILQRVKVNFDYDVSQMISKDSLEMTDADRLEILAAVQAHNADKVIITHGTDTMVDTGKVLKQAAGKTIVIMGAMQPAIMKLTDADFNLGVAVAAVQALPQGVYLCMNGRIYDVDKVVKNRAQGQFQDA
ncbi:MAG: asparaginase domain-containing protein [Gammaproteobacteria bacterium]|nr:asparaginase domain-containing protein [Gammaproteobacteria bacterium]